MNLDALRKNLTEIRGRIAEAARTAGRAPAEITIVAVTKRSPVEVIAPLLELGANDCGENYPQDLWAKVKATEGLAVRWHLIGHLQGNKAKRTYPLVRMVHAVDSLRLLKALDDLARGLPDPAPVCLQVNTSEEEAKHGWSPSGLLEEAEAIAACASVPVVGLMTIAGYGTTNESARPSFVALRESREALRARTGLALPHLSMGMSNDFESAIEEGATLVRIGSALFEGAFP